MGRGPAYTFWQRRHRHMKICSDISDHQENANQKHNAILPHTCRTAIIKKNK